MERIPSSPPHITPIPAEEKVYLWSVMIPVYNCAEFLPEALESVLIQDPGKDQMQIEVVDDASTDADIETLVKEIGQGRITFFRQNENVGSLRNFETCINRSRGKFVHLLHGDDRVKPGFYHKIAHLFQQFPEAGAAFSSYSFINEKGEKANDFHLENSQEGILSNWLVRIAEYQKIQYAAMVVRRDVYERLGSFYGVSCGEDWEMWVRIAKHYPVAYTPQPLADYRSHSGSLSWKSAVAGMTLRDFRLCIKNIQEHIPQKYRGRVRAQSKKHGAHFLVGLANSVWKKTRNFSDSQKLIKQSLELSQDPYLLLRILKFYYKVGLTKSSNKN